MADSPLYYPCQTLGYEVDAQVPASARGASLVDHANTRDRAKPYMVIQRRLFRLERHDHQFLRRDKYEGGRRGQVEEFGEFLRSQQRGIGVVMCLLRQSHPCC